MSCINCSTFAAKFGMPYGTPTHCSECVFPGMVCSQTLKQQQDTSIGRRLKCEEEKRKKEIETRDAGQRKKILDAIPSTECAISGCCEKPLFGRGGDAVRCDKHAFGGDVKY